VIRRPFVPLAVALALLVVACSDDGGPGPGPTSTTSTSTSAASTTTATDSTTSTALEAHTALALRGDGIGVAAFGEPTDDVVAAVTTVLGASAGDDGWQPSTPSCPGDRMRVVTWDGLHLTFVESATDPKPGGRFLGWDLDGAPPALATPAGFGFGATTDDAHDLYGQEVELVPAEDPFPAYLLIHVDGAEISAFLDDQGTVTNLHGGVGCSD
jgi:hypothetical protein